MDDNGFFQYLQDGETVTCPNPGKKGCCCACNYVDDFDEYLKNSSAEESTSTDGLKDGVSFCECSSIGGAWAGADTVCENFKDEWETTFNLCTNGAYFAEQETPIEYDRRYPEGCCIELEDGTFNCEQTCSEQECSDLQTDQYPNGTASHYPTLACDDPISEPFICGDGQSRTLVDDGGDGVSSRKNSNIITILNSYTDSSISSNYNRTTQGSLSGSVSACITENECTLTNNLMCDGCWLGLKENGDPFSCSDSETDVVTNFIKNGTISRSVVDEWGLGEYHIAGYYAGIFNYAGEDSHHDPVTGFGNIGTGMGQPYIIERIEGDIKEFKSFTKNQYAVIVAEFDYRNNPITLGNKTKSKESTSKFDSVRNMNLPMFSNIRNKHNYNGIGSGRSCGWSIPSKHLSSFIYNNTNMGEFVENSTKHNPAHKWRSMNGTYWSSTSMLSLTHYPLFYVQNFQSGFVGVAETNTTHRTRLALTIKLV